MQISASAELSGPIADPVGHVVITTRAGVGPDRDRLQLDLDLGMHDGRISVDGTIWERLLPRGVLQGSVPFDSQKIAARLIAGEVPTRDHFIGALGALDLDLTARKVPLRTFDPWLPVRGKLSGSLVGSLHLGGSLQDPSVRGTWLLDDAKIARVPISRALLTLTDRDGGGEGGLSLGLDAAFGEIDGQEVGFKVMADIPLEINLLAPPSGEALMERPRLDIQLNGAVPLRLAEAVVPGMRVEQGLIQMAGTIRGSLAEMVPELSVGLVDGRLSLDSTGVTYGNVNVQAALGDHTFALTAFHMESSDSTDIGLPRENLLSASRLYGALEVVLSPDWTPLSATGSFDFEGFYLSALPDRQLRVSGNTKLSGTKGKIALRGGLRVDRALMRLHKDFFVEDTSTELHPDIQLIGVESGEKSEPRGLEGLIASVPEWLKVVLDVDLTETLYGTVSMPLEDRFGAVGRDFSIVNVEGAIGGNLRAELDNNKFIVLGDLEPERGQVRVLGKTFQIQQGTITFTGRDVLTPLLDLTATYPTRDYGPMMLKIAGTPDNPTITFTSDSYAEEDVMAILLTGSPASGGGDALGQLLTSAVLGIAQGGLGGVGGVGGGVVESVQLDTLGVQGGFRITRNVSLYTRYNFANNLTGDPYFVEITLEWALPDDWSMEVQSGEGASVSAWHTWKF
jgi:TamB, inner membrane protein subunit of TAM complex